MEREKGITLTRDHVRHVAELARLDLSEEEIATYTTQLDAILGYVAQLEQLEVAEVPGTAHAVDLTCPWREDEGQPSMDRRSILGQAPEEDGEHFVVPRALEP
jgi:aspartyl-tRNA(Asn)/glutamyl-tRNA(Gln) amidotransferase subunit C